MAVWRMWTAKQRAIIERIVNGERLMKQRTSYYFVDDRIQWTEDARAAKTLYMNQHIGRAEDGTLYLTRHYYYVYTGTQAEGDALVKCLQAEADIEARNAMVEALEV